MTFVKRPDTGNPNNRRLKRALEFLAKDVKADRRNTTTKLVNRYYSRPALAPGFGTPTTAPPAPPANVRNRNGQLTWSAGDANAVRYAIYQVPTTTTTSPACNLIDARNLVAIVPAKQGSDELAISAGEGTVYVTVIDRWGRESAYVRASA